MAKRNKLERYGVKVATLCIPFDDRGEYSHPWIVLSDGAERWPEVKLRIDMQRNRLHANGYRQSTWERFQAVQDATNVPSWLDVGAGAFSHCYGANIDSVRLSNIQKVAKLAAACGLDEIHEYGGDVLASILASLEAAGCPIVKRYVGCGDSFDDLHGVPDAYRGHAARFSRSADAMEAIAAYHAEQAAMQRQRESEREAATA